MSWLFGNAEDQEALRASAKTPSGKAPPQICTQCRALKRDCQCASGIVVAKDGTRRCKRCAHDAERCTCPQVWGRRELELRETLALDTRVSNMLEFLQRVEDSIDAATSHADTYAQLIAHGKMLLAQEQLLESQRNKGVLTEHLLEEHNAAVNQWMQLCDEQLGITMRQLDLSALRDAIRVNSQSVGLTPRAHHDRTLADGTESDGDKAAATTSLSTQVDDGRPAPQRVEH